MQRDINNALQETTDLKSEAKSSKKLRSFFESSSVIHIPTPANSFVVECQAQEEIGYYWEKLGAGMTTAAG